MAVRIDSFSDAVFVAVSGVSVVFLMLACLALVIGLMAKLSALQSAGEAETMDHPLADVAGGQAVSEMSVKVHDSTQGTPVLAVDTWYGGNMLLYDTEEKTAACLMAIVSHETGIPLKELQWKSIRNLEGRKL